MKKVNFLYSIEIYHILFSTLGIQEEREGLFEITFHSKAHYQKRSYQCIKCMVLLFSKCRQAYSLLNSSSDLKKKWSQAVEWLSEELDRVIF